MYDLIIIGGGPAAVGAAVYAGRKKLKTLLITESFGGQSLVSDNVENWIGTKMITGYDLAKNMEEHVRAQEAVDRLREVAEVICPHVPSHFQAVGQFYAEFPQVSDEEARACLAEG